MKKFRFSLERVREWREKQVALEEARLEAMYEERRGIEERIAALEREQRQNEQAVLGAESADALSLQALDQFRRHTRAVQAALARERQGCHERISAQRLRIMQAQRGVRLLDKVKERKLKDWQAGFEKEIDEQAAEAHLSRWNSG